MKYDDSERKLPCVADFLFSYSTISDHVSLRDSEVGSWYIQMLCKTIREKIDSKDISHIFTFVNREVSKMTAKFENIKVKMMPTFENQLTKLFYKANELKEKLKDIERLIKELLEQKGSFT